MHRGPKTGFRKVDRSGSVIVRQATYRELIGKRAVAVHTARSRPSLMFFRRFPMRVVVLRFLQNACWLALFLVAGPLPGQVIVNGASLTPAPVVSNLRGEVP